MLTVQRVYELIDALAPFDTQADFDNSGLLVGNPQAEVTGHPPCAGCDRPRD